MLDSAAVRRRRIWPWIVVGLLGFVVVATIAILAAVPLTSDALRHRMIDTLSKRLDADVALPVEHAGPGRYGHSSPHCCRWAGVIVRRAGPMPA